MTKTKKRYIRGAIVVVLFLIAGPTLSQEVRQQSRLSVTFENLSCSVLIPPGWRSFKSSNGLWNLIPKGQADERGTGMYIWATPRQGKKATKIFDTDELLTTSDGKTALIRYCRSGGFTSVIRPTDPTSPCAVAYIEEGDLYVEIVLGTTDQEFAEAAKVFKRVVASYRATPLNKSSDASGGRML
jgi:hypothetical protein